MIKLIYLLGLILSWIFFYNILKAKNVRLPKLKTTLIVFMFASLIYEFSYSIYAVIDRSFFSLQRDGTVELTQSPFRIPLNQDMDYCNQFKDQEGKVITMVSSRDDGKYCGTFWRFEKNKPLFIPYKKLNAKQTVYWASPVLKIVTTK